MNRTFVGGIALFFAVLTLAMMGSQQDATAGHGCGGCGGCGGLFGGHCHGGGLFARAKCHGGLFAHKRRCGGLFGRHHRCGGWGCGGCGGASECGGDCGGISNCGGRKCHGGLFARWRARRAARCGCAGYVNNCCGAQPVVECPEPACGDCGATDCACGGAVVSEGEWHSGDAPAEAPAEDGVEVAPSVE